MPTRGVTSSTGGVAFFNFDHASFDRPVGGRPSASKGFVGLGAFQALSRSQVGRPEVRESER